MRLFHSHKPQPPSEPAPLRSALAAACIAVILGLGVNGVVSYIPAAVNRAYGSFQQTAQERHVFVTV